MCALKTRRLKSVKEMHVEQANEMLMRNAQKLVSDAAKVVQSDKSKYIATNDLIDRLLSLDHGWWEGYRCPDSTGKREAGIGDPASGKMVLAKMLKLGSNGNISAPEVCRVKDKTFRGYVVAELRAVASN